MFRQGITEPTLRIEAQRLTRIVAEQPCDQCGELMSESMKTYEYVNDVENGRELFFCNKKCQCKHLGIIK